MKIAVENFQLVLDSHRWVPLPAVGFTSNGASEVNQDDLTPPPHLMVHPPIAVFINGVSSAMNELRPCAPVVLKQALAQELINGLQSVSDSLLMYNASRLLRENESALFISLCRAFVEVVFPYCATCFGRCFPGGAVLITESKNIFDGLSRLLTVSSGRLPTKLVTDKTGGHHVTDNGEGKETQDNGNPSKVEGEDSVAKAQDSSVH